MSREISMRTREMVYASYRTGIIIDRNIWSVSAKDDATKQLHTVKAPAQDEAITALTLSVGIDL